jgi:inner membrane protease subunit SOM1
MAPPISTIPVSDLEGAVNTLPSGKRRNPPVDLSDCALKELVQYKCNVEPPKKKGDVPVVLCQPLVHLLRR